MGTKLQRYWASLDRKILVSQRELVLGITACTLAGILVGILVSPRKAMTIGSYNGNNNLPPEEADLEVPDEEEV